MKKLDNIHECEEMSHSELLATNGGETIGFWIGYAVGSVVKAVQDAIAPSCSCTCK